MSTIPAIFSNNKKKWLSLMPFLALGAIIFLLNINTFSGGFIYDDLDLVVNDPQIREGHIFDANLWKAWGRSTRTISLMIDYRLFGNNPAGYHFQNILWHLLSTLLIYGIFEKLSGDRTLSFMGALLFAVHPIHVEAVANTSNRKDPLCMFFSLISFGSYIRFINEDNKKRWFWFLTSLLGWYLALNSKQVAIVLPLSMIAYEYIFLPKERRFLTKAPSLMVGLAVAAVALYAYVIYEWDISKMKTTLTGFEGDPTKFDFISNSALSFWTYLKLVFFPLGLSPDYVVVLSDAFQTGVIISWAALTGIILSAFYLVRSRPLVSFGMFWFFINYLPVSNIIPSSYMVADRYMYIPSLGICLAFAAIWTTIKNAFLQSRRGGRDSAGWHLQLLFIAILLILAVFSLKTIKYNSVWGDERKLWDHAIKMSPRSHKAYYNSGAAYAKSGDYRRVIDNSSKAIELRPFGYAKAYYNRGSAYYRLGDYRRSISDFNTAIDLNYTPYEKAFNNRGLAYYASGKYPEAIRDFDRAIEFNPGDEFAWCNRGNAHYALGDHQQAIEDYNKAVDLNPRYAEAYSNRGYVYYLLGKNRESLSDLKKATEIDPKHADANNNLALVYSRLGHKEEALHYYRTAAALGSEEAKDFLAGLNR